MISNLNLFVFFNRLLVFVTGFSIGSGTRTQWKESGLKEKMESTLFLRILGFLQVCLCSSLISETVLWLTVRLFGVHHLYLVGEARFTLQGVELVNLTTIFAILGCAIPIFLSDENFEKVNTNSVSGMLINRLQPMFWIANTIIGLQLFRDSNNPYAFVAFCTLRLIAFVNISHESPGWHLLAYFGLCLLGNPLRPSGSLASDLSYEF